MKIKQMSFLERYIRLTVIFIVFAFIIGFFDIRFAGAFLIGGGTKGLLHLYFNLIKNE